MSIPSDVQKFPGGTQDKGVNVFEPDIGAEITWSEETLNVTGGVRRGVGVRYGMAPLAGHSNTETPAGTATNGIQRSEITTGSQGLIYRETIYGVVPIIMAPYDGSYPKSNKQFYLYLVGLDDGSNVTLDACFGSTLDSSVNKQANTLVAGLAQSSYRQESPLVRQHKTELLNLPQATTPTAADMQSLLRMPASRYWTPYAHVSVPGKRIPYFWMLGQATTPPADSTHAGNLQLWNIPLTNLLNPSVYGGAPSESLTRDYVENNRRQLRYYALDAAGEYVDAEYRLFITDANTQAVPAYGTSPTYVLAGITATKLGSATTYSAMTNAVINDPGAYTNSKHDAVLVAAEKPYALVYQDWLKAVKGMMPRWVDLTSPGMTPRNSLSFNLTGQTTSAFVSGNAPLGTGPGAETGVLQKDRNYEIGFSYYNKLLNYECNVVYGATFYATQENQGVVVAQTFATGENFFDAMQGAAGNQLTVPWEFSETQTQTGGEYPRGMHINDYEYRFYYREAGTSEWLPAGSYDAAQLWFYWKWPASYLGATPQGAIICAGPVAGLPGGQPNGFVDYSPLPNQRYINVVNYENRAFWFAEKTMHFSLANNVYAYPTRNITTLPAGAWLGGIVHTRTGQITQQSRLITFATNATYVGRFTGERTLQSVRISFDTVGQFEVDGSDFTMDVLTDGTAFSARAACIADGNAYWWGPQGVYKFDGVSLPQKISGGLEPDIMKYADMSRVGEIHAIYNKRTSEVVWFYPPRTPDAAFPTYGLVFNTENGKFYPFKFRCQVDASQNLNVENDTTPTDVTGERVLLHCRETASSTVQRTFYFDDLVLAGEQGPARELTVLTVATPTSGQRRLTLAAGSVGITAGGIAVDDFIAVQNVLGYAPAMTGANDFIAKVTAVNNGSNYIDILLPDGASLPDASLTGQTAFPIYQMKPESAGLHGITYKVDTNYWLPGGMSESWVWQYLYFLFKYPAWPTPKDPFTLKSLVSKVRLAYRTLVCREAVSDTLQLVNNSADHTQIHHPLRNVARSANGQALKYTLSGIHIGDPWTLEYLEAHCIREKGFTLKEFQG